MAKEQAEEARAVGGMASNDESGARPMESVNTAMAGTPAINGAHCHVAESMVAAAGVSKGATETTIDDCASMLGAVESRLREAVIGPLDEPAPSAIRAAVLECAQSLVQLQVLLTDERRRYLRVQALAEDVRDKLDQARRDLVSTQRDERRAKHQALHDGLTALPNRSFFRQRLDAELIPDRVAARAATSVLAVLYVDLDGMKAVNDTYGHCTGDEVLRVVAARLLHAVRDGDMVCRQGGDEFALLITGLPLRHQAAAMIGALARKLCDRISAPIRVGDLELAVQASIGIALHPDDGGSADVLLRRADAAMYRAKRGLDRYAFFDASAPA